MDKPLISIVLPIYNVEHYLERCLKSISAQTFSDFEVLCINDGSTDDSQLIIDKYVQNDNRFKSFIKDNGGLSDARNYGLVRSKADHIMFLDSDDFVEKDLLKDTYEKAIKYDLDIVIFDFYQFYVQDDHRDVVNNVFDEDKIYNLKEQPDLLCYVNNAAWNKLYRTELFTKNDITYPFGYRHQDLATTPKLLYLAEKVGFVNKPLYNYLVDRPNNLTQQYDKQIYHIIDMNMEYLQFYKNNKIFQQYYEQLKYLCIINILTSLKKVVNFTDYHFVREFINDVFKFIKHYFPDYPACIYDFKQEKVDIIYSNKSLLLLYISYRKVKGQLK